MNAPITFPRAKIALLAGVCVSSACATAKAGPSRLGAVQSWAYQLQGIEAASPDWAALAVADTDLLVVDYADHGRPLSRADVAKLKVRRDGQTRQVLAYLSIGEAEDYRYYWKASWKKEPPAYLAAANPEWKGNYKVRYWDPAWRAIVLDYVDRILAAGFDGVYLDVIDAFEFFGPGGALAEQPTAGKDMAELVLAIAHHGRETRGAQGFAVVPQNGAGILRLVSPKLAARYLAAVDGIGAEDTFFFGKAPEDNPLEIQTLTLGDLHRFRDAGRVVLAVDYLRDAKKAARFITLARDNRFVPYVATRALDRLVEQPKSGSAQ